MSRASDKKYFPGDLVAIEDSYSNNTQNKVFCLILDIIDPLAYLGLTEDLIQIQDDFIKEVYKVFLHGNISLISPDDVLEKINEKETKNTR